MYNQERHFSSVSDFVRSSAKTAGLILKSKILKKVEKIYLSNIQYFIPEGPCPVE